MYIIWLQVGCSRALNLTRMNMAAVFLDKRFLATKFVWWWIQPTFVDLWKYVPYVLQVQNTKQGAREFWYCKFLYSRLYDRPIQGHEWKNLFNCKLSSDFRQVCRAHALLPTGTESVIQSGLAQGHSGLMETEGEIKTKILHDIWSLRVYPCSG